MEQSQAPNTDMERTDKKSSCSPLGTTVPRWAYYGVSLTVNTHGPL